MIYNNIREAVFIKRLNRFVAEIEINGKTELCHVKNTGRCAELLIKGCTAYVEESDDNKRKTKYSLICVIKNGILINTDSQAPNKAVGEWLKEGGLFGGCDVLKAERTYKNSRFDFYAEIGKRRIFIEVKGVTLEDDGVVRFPDAPTERGIKHLNELCECVKQGYEAYIIFVIQMSSAKYFEPNRQNGDDFYIALKNAVNNNVKAIAYNCIVKPDFIKINEEVEVRLGDKAYMH